MNYEIIEILGTKIHRVTMQDVVKWSQSQIDSVNGLKVIFTPNPELIMHAQKSLDYQKILNQADLSTPDGIGLQMAAELNSYHLSQQKIIRFGQILIRGIGIGLRPFYKRQYKVLPERVAGADLLGEIIKHNPKISVVLLGGENQIVNELACSKLKTQYPLIGQVNGIWGGIISQDGYGASDSDTIERINAICPDLIMVGFGSPKQERWIINHKNAIKAKIIIGGGATIYFIAGYQKRASRNWTKLGLEWLHRLIHDPGRLKRIFSAFPVFPLYVALHKYFVLES